MATPLKEKKKKKVKLEGNLINRENLVNHLEAVNPGLAKKDMLEQASHYIFSGDRIITYNDQISVSAPYTDIQGNFSVKADDFYKIIKGISEEEIAVEVTPDLIKIKSSSTDAELAISTEETTVIELYKSLDIENQKIVSFENPDKFLDGLEFCKFCASKDLTADALFCVCIDGNHVMAADDVRASFFELKETLPSMLIPAASLEQLIHYPINSFAIAKSWIHFFTETGTAYSCRTVSGEYPDIESFIQSVMESESTVHFELPEALTGALDACIPMCKGKTPLEKQVTITYDKNKITVTAMKDIGKLTKTIPYKSEDHLSFQINPIFLKDILGTCNQFTLYPTIPIIVFSTDEFKHVISVHIEE
jgi:DNA polymerase III sliding clamp (beta) subunit (PCNA family)